jgi:DNA-binding NarL/FixJ family response regulator
MIRTLIVDDHPAIRRGLTDVLRGEPGIVPVGAAADSASALEMAGREHPRCVVVDHNLGAENGLELISRLRALPDAPGVVLYSAFLDAALGEAAAAAGAGAAVGKTAPVEEVIDAIRRVGRSDVASLF